MKNRILFILALTILIGALATAGTDTIPTRSSGQVITADAVNVFKRVLTGDVVPRNTSGVATDKGGNLGAAGYAWNSVVTDKVSVRGENGNLISLVAPSPVPSPFSITLPSALPSPSASPAPLLLSNSGLISLGQFGADAIADGTITTAKLADGAVTKPKLSAANYSVSASSGTYSSNATSPTNIANLSVTITTSGRPVLVGIIFTDFSSNTCINSSTSAIAECYLTVTRPSVSVLGSMMRNWATQSGGAFNSFTALDVPAAGTYTYTASGYVSSSVVYMTLTAAKLFAIEL